MNENIDLTKILKDCPKGTRFYSTVFGEVSFIEVYPDDMFPIIIRYNKRYVTNLTAGGKLKIECDGECILFPSKDQRDWSKFVAPWYNKEENLIKPKFKVGDIIRHKGADKGDVYEISKVYNDSYGLFGSSRPLYMKYQDVYELVPNKFDPKTLKPFDKVLVRDDYKECWLCRFFSHIVDGIHIYKYITIGSAFKYCIPYNDETKHLVGTTEEAPGFYKYWDD